ncbi:MAG: class I SAM-dependent methyltransferase [Candidatus Bathyarchaeia archaeon]
MKLSKIEKWSMNRPLHAEQVINLARKLLNFVNVGEGKNLLEIGCGYGTASRYIAKKYQLYVTAIDLDLELIRPARKNNADIPNLGLLEADATRLPFQDNDFDIVLSIQVMHHIPNWLSALREIKRVLKPKGYLLYVDMLWPKLLAKIGKSFKHPFGVTTLQDLNKFVEENNFSTIHSSSSRSLVIFDHYEAVYQKD